MDVPKQPGIKCLIKRETLSQGGRVWGLLHTRLGNFPQIISNQV